MSIRARRSRCRSALSGTCSTENVVAGSASEVISNRGTQPLSATPPTGVTDVGPWPARQAVDSTQRETVGRKAIWARLRPHGGADRPAVRSRGPGAQQDQLGREGGGSPRPSGAARYLIRDRDGKVP